MSGGSFDYLCHKDVDEIVSARGDLRAMIDTLGELDRSDAAVQASLRVLDRIDALAESLTPDLQTVWQAVEWWKSCDYSREQAQEAVYTYRGKVDR